MQNNSLTTHVDEMLCSKTRTRSCNINQQLINHALTEVVSTSARELNFSICFFPSLSV